MAINVERSLRRTAAEPTWAGVRAAGVGKSFGARPVLKSVDLEIQPGEFVALLGRSGSGKSTLLRILAQLDRDYTGRIEVPARRAVVFQDARLLPWAKIVDNVQLGLRSPDRRSRAVDALGEVGLADHADAWPKTLSGGEAQRAALARALVRDPQLLLLDEPFGALDALTRIKMHILLKDLCRRHEPSVLLVTHDVDEALLLADRILVLDDGAMALEITVDLPSHKPRADPRFVQLRGQLLTAIGVEDDDQ